MRNLKDVADVVNVPQSNITKAMPDNIEKYHKKVKQTVLEIMLQFFTTKIFKCKVCFYGIDVCG